MSTEVLKTVERTYHVYCYMGEISTHSALKDAREALKQEVESSGGGYIQKRQVETIVITTDEHVQGHL